MDIKTTLIKFGAIDSKYLNWYVKLIEHRLFNESTSDCIEKHHIIPTCVSDEYSENIVKLSAREHFIAHLLLWKAFKSSTIYFKLANAVHVFNQNAKTQGRSLNSVSYHLMRLAVKQARSGRATFFDKTLKKYVKENVIFANENPDLFSSARMVLNLVTGKRTYISVDDPLYDTSVHVTSSVQKFIDILTGDILKMDTRDPRRIADPDRYKGLNTHKTPPNPMTGLRHRFDIETNSYVRIPDALAKSDTVRYKEVQISVDTQTGISGWYQKELIQANPDRYKHPNTNKVDVYSIEKSKMIKIKTSDFNDEKHG